MSFQRSILLGLTVLAVTPASALQYSFQPLGTGVGFYSKAAGINNNGQVIGYTYDSQFFSSRGRGFVYSNGSMTDIGILTGGLFSNSADINDLGVVVGDASNPQNLSHAIIYENGVLTDIDPIIGDRFYSYANGINNIGQIVGSTNLGAYLYAGGVKTRLLNMGGAYDINDAGTIVGVTVSDHAAVYKNGTLYDLGTLGGVKSYANSINELGQIVGSANNPNNTPHAFLYSNGSMIDIGALPGGDLCYANSINDLGQIVGMSTYNGSTYLDMHGFLYSDGVMYDINSLLDSNADGWIISSVAGINNKGQIAATAYNQTTMQTNAVLLTPIAVPEPLTMIVFGVGIGSMAFRKRFHKENDRRG